VRPTANGIRKKVRGNEYWNSFFLNENNDRWRFGFDLVYQGAPPAGLACRLTNYPRSPSTRRSSRWTVMREMDSR